MACPQLLRLAVCSCACCHTRLRAPTQRFRNPPPFRSSTPGVFKFDFEEQDLDEPAVRKLVWEEMAHYDGSSASGAAKAQ